MDVRRRRAPTSRRDRPRGSVSGRVGSGLGQSAAEPAVTSRGRGPMRGVVEGVPILRQRWQALPGGPIVISARSDGITSLMHGITSLMGSAKAGPDPSHVAERLVDVGRCTRCARVSQASPSSSSSSTVKSPSTASTRGRARLAASRAPCRLWPRARCLLRLLPPPLHNQRPPLGGPSPVARIGLIGGS